MHTMNKKELFDKLNEYSFMLDDITLYLNTHPNCKKGMEAYKKFKRLREEAFMIYSEKFGPICRYDVDSDCDWDWINKPWPWEGECKK